MSTWEWQYALGFAVGLVVGCLFGAWAWWKGTEDDREQDKRIAYKDGEFAGQKAGYAQAEAVQRAKDSARAVKASKTRKARRVA